MASLQPVSDPASLDGGLAGSNQEVPISSRPAKQRHRRWKASLKISTRRLASASAESRERRGGKKKKMEGCCVLQEVEKKVEWAKSAFCLPS